VPDNSSSGDDSSGGSRPDLPGLPPELDPRGRRAAKVRLRESRQPQTAAHAAPGQPAGLDREAPVGNRRSVARGARLGVRIATAALSVAVLLGSGFAWASYSNFISNVPTIDIPSAQGAKGQKDIDGADQNILIAGNDDRTGYTAAQLAELGTTADGGSENTDTMMLLHVPANGSKATVISFPRDSYVNIPGFGMNKLNAAYPDGVNANNGNKADGAALLIQTIENLTGLTINHYIQVNLLGFYNISEAVGPITVCLLHSERPAANDAQAQSGDIGIDAGTEPDGQIVLSYSGINLPAGTSQIVGKQALAFVRQRHGLTNGDLDRIKRQQYFLGAVFRKVASAGTLLDPLKLEKLLKAVANSLTVSSGTNLLNLASQVQDLSAGNVTFETIPIAGPDNNTPAGDVELVNTAEMPTFIDTLIGEDPAVALKNAKAAAPGSFTTDVLNASTTNGLATKNSAALTALGFKTVIGSNTPPVQATTTIEYPQGMEGGAKALAAEIPGATVLVSSTVTDVTLYIGQNLVQVKTLTPPATAAPAAAASKTASATTAAAKTTTTAPKATPTPTAVAGSSTAANTGCIN
jgi:LCP family protein required for cell wall assembly